MTQPDKEGPWTFNTSTPWYYPTNCPGCIPMPKDNTSTNFVWLDFKASGKKVEGVLTVGGEDGDSMAVPTSNCSRVERTESGEQRVVLVWAMQDFHVRSAPAPAPAPPPCCLHPRGSKMIPAPDCRLCFISPSVYV